MAIEIDGKKYKVTENLGFCHDRGEYAKAIMTDDGERIAVKSTFRGAKWRFSKPIIVLTNGLGACGQVTPNAEGKAPQPEVNGINLSGMEIEMIEKFGYNEARIFDIELSEKKSLLVFTEACNQYFALALTKEEVIELANDLLRIAETMANT